MSARIFAHFGSNDQATLGIGQTSLALALDLQRPQALNVQDTITQRRFVYVHASSHASGERLRVRQFDRLRRSRSGPRLCH